MTERKTTEIKLRVTPDEKARWQIEAERQGIALSELIRQTMNGQSTALVDQVRRLRMLTDPSVDTNYAMLVEREAHPLVALDTTAEAMQPYGAPPFGIVTHPYGPLPVFVVDAAAALVAQSDDSPQEDVPTSDEADSFGDEQPKPWMFEGRSGV